MRQNYLAAAAILACSVAVAQADVFNMPSGQTSVTFVTIGHPGNAADTKVMDDGTTGYGAVGYVYQMDKYDVTTAQFTQFLNAVAATDTYGLYTSGMATNFPTVGISRSGSPGGYTYSVIGNGNVPVFDVKWEDVARFTNWLQNGQPTGPEGAGTTETGTYTINGATSDAALSAVVRNAAAEYVIPTENEWYKAAYYKGGGTNAGYWTYATQSDAPPSNVLSAVGINNANYYNSGFTDAVNSLTSVGAFASSPSACGTFDQSGDVYQWNESLVHSASRGMRGGAWFTGGLPSTHRGSFSQTFQDQYIGFRVAEVTPVPEPSTFALLAMGAAGLLLWAKRRKASA